MKSRPDIFSYNDYRKFLKDFLEVEKILKKKSLRKVAAEAKISASFLSMLLKNQKKLKPSMAEKLNTWMKLNLREKKFFNYMVILCDSEKPDERMAAFHQMKRFKEFRVAAGDDIEAYKFLTHWYYVAIRELANLEGFEPTEEWVGQYLTPRVAAKDIRTALAYLLEHNYILKEGQAWRPAAKYNNCREGVFRLSLAEFHRQMLGIAADAIENVDRTERSILGHTIVVDPERYQEVLQVLESALGDTQEIHKKNRGKGQVYHLALGLVPLSKKVKKKAS